MADLLTVREARLQILSNFKPIGTIEIPFDQGLGRVLAESVFAGEDIPSFPNSSMDGFAVRSTDLTQASAAHPILLPVVGEIPAGSSRQLKLEPGQSIRIMTGAPLPAGADAVIPLEDIQELEPQAPNPSIQIQSLVQPGQYIRPRGQDLRAGENIFQAGRRLSPQDIGLLASLGFAVISVYQMPKVALISSGDELIQPGQPIAPGKIRDANSYMLASLLSQNYTQVVPLGVAPDRFEAIQKKLDAAVEQRVDLIITSAGVSVGAYDYVRAVIESRGKLDFWRVNIRPGKPIAFGAYQEIPIIGLPGNPVSAFVGFEIFVKPVLDRLSGVTQTEQLVFKAVLAEAVQSDGRESYLRARVILENGVWSARLTGHQGSGNLRALSEANALLIVPSGVKSLPAGSEVDAWVFHPWN